MRDMTGIEHRFDKNGREQFRAYVTDPANRNRKRRAPWTYSYPEAKGWRARVLSQGLPDDDPRSAPTVERASETFLAGAKAGTIRSRKRKAYAGATLRGYEQAFRDWINPELGSMPTDALKRSQVQRFVDRVAAERASGTARNIFHSLAALYTFLLTRYDEIEHDPTHGVVLPAPGNPRERYASPEEAQLLIGVLPHRLAVPWALAFYAGLRKGEIQSLPLDMVDLDAGWLRVQYSVDSQEGFKGPKSGAGERDVPIFDALRPFLERQVGREAERLVVTRASTPDEPGSLLLPSRRGSRWGVMDLGYGGARPGPNNTTRRYGFLDQCRERWRDAGLDPIGLHEARHSFATALIRAGYDPKLVSEWVGHAQASTTLNIYVKRRGRQEDVSGLAAKMNTYLAQ